MNTTQQLYHKLGLNKITLSGFTEVPPIYSRVYKSDTSDNRPYKQYFYVGELPPVPQVASEISPTTIVDAKMSPPVTFYQGEYRMGLVFTDKALRWDKYQVLRDKVDKLGKAARRRVEIAAAAPKNNNSTGGWDAATLFNAAHTVLDTTATYSNKFGALGPGYAALQAMYKYGATVIDDAGYPMQMTPIAIECHPALAPSWRAVLGSDRLVKAISKDATTVTNADSTAMSPWGGFLGPDAIIENPYLSSEDNYFVHYSAHTQTFIWGVQPTTKQITLDDPDGIKHVIKLEFALGWVDARGIATNQ